MESEIAYLGGGCFWCLEAIFSQTIGVLSVVPGYSGGKEKNPTYEKVSSGKTGHAEVVKIIFDPEDISYESLLHIFFSVHDPTTPNRQGSDMGEQYRSIILYVDPKQQKSAQDLINNLEKQDIYDAPIVTQVVPFSKFYPAESYHQKYFAKNPEKAYCQTVINPKLAKFREKYKEFYKD